jgi:D-arabinose 1-dehydrogenase-like Zn-dependent alcohol dehydrogenase
VTTAEVAEPEITEPDDVVVRVAGAGICRTDLHIVQGELAEAFQQTLPLTLGHENSGWVHQVGPAVAHLAVGDPVIVHPAVTCGHCLACRSGTDMHCASWRFPGVDGWPGGYAELMRTSARALVRLPDGTDPAPLAPHADAGLTAMHAVRRLVPYTTAASTVVTIGAGGSGRSRCSCCGCSPRPGSWSSTSTSGGPPPPPARRARRAPGSPGTPPVEAVLDLTNGLGADVVLDLVGDGDVPGHAFRMLRKGGVYSIVGYGGGLRIEHLDMINRELTILGNQIGSYQNLVELMGFVASGRVTIESQLFPLEDAVDVLREVDAARVPGRAVLVP